MSTDHTITVHQLDAWTWRARCTCGYRSKRWDTAAEAHTAAASHLRRARQAQRRQERREHRTNLTPMRYV